MNNDLKKEVGIVKYTFGGRGIIVGCYPKQDIHFDNLDLKNKDIVVFDFDDQRNKLDNVKLASDYSFEVKELSRYSSIELALVRLVNKELDNLLLTRKLDGRDLLINNLDNHVRSTDIENLTLNYKIYIAEWHRQKAGDDDSISIWFSSTSLDAKYKYDSFIKRLLPSIRKPIHSDSGFAPWSRMMNEYKADKENWLRLEDEAMKLSEQIRQRAIETYNTELHKVEIKKELNKVIKTMLSDEDSKFKEYFKYWLR